MSQRAKVLELYRSLLRFGKDYVHGYDYFRKQLKESFLLHKDEKDPEKIEVYLAYGEYIHKELEALQMLKKYKKLKRNYYSKHNKPSEKKTEP